MKKLLLPLPEKYVDYGLFILRVFFGFALMYGHGLGKWTRLFGGDEIKFADPFGLGPVASLALATFAEVICAILLMLGLFTRLALIPIIIVMATAFFVVHFSQEFAQQEKALLFGFAFIALFLTGPGRISLDHLLWGDKSVNP